MFMCMLMYMGMGILCYVLVLVMLMYNVVRLDVGDILHLCFVLMV